MHKYINAIFKNILITKYCYNNATKILAFIPKKKSFSFFTTILNNYIYIEGFKNSIVNNLNVFSFNLLLPFYLKLFSKIRKYINTVYSFDENRTSHINIH